MELIEEGRLSEDAFEEIFLHASPGALKPSPGEVHRRKAYVASAVLSQDGFMAVLGQLSTLAGEGCAEGGVEYTPEEREAQGWHTLWCKHAAASKVRALYDTFVASHFVNDAFNYCLVV